MGIPLYVICGFSLAAFNILSLSLFFVILFTVSLDMFLFGLALYGTLCASWLGTVSFPGLRKFSTIISSNIFSAPFSLLLWDPYETNISALYVVPGSLKFCPHFFSFFFLFPIQWQLFPLLYLPVCWSIPLYHFSQFSSVAQSSLTLCDPMDSSTPGSLSITNSWSLLKFMSIKSLMPSKSSLSPPVSFSCLLFSSTVFFHFNYYILNLCLVVLCFFLL